MENCSELEDTFDLHFQHDLSPELFSSVSKKQYEISKNSWPSIKQFAVKLPIVKNTNATSKLIDEKDIIYATIPDQPKLIEVPDLKLFCIKSQISNNVIRSNLVHTGENNLTALQLELLSIMHEYKDLYYTERTFTNAEEIRFVYCLHAINHALKTRLKIINHNAKINEKLEIPGEFRDQGLVKPKVLIIVPFRNSALRLVAFTFYVSRCI